VSISPALVPLIRDQRFRPWGPGLHVATGTAHFLGMPIWNNTVAIELAAPGQLLVWNPIALTAELRRSLDELKQGTGRRVTTLLAPMDWHHRALGDWQQAFPDAATWLVSDRITVQQPHVRGQILAGDRPEVPGGEPDLALLAVRGCRQPVIERDGPRREWFVLHRPSRSLLIGDMLTVNAQVTLPQRWVAGWRVGFAYNRAGFRPSDPSERAAFARDVLAWDIERALTAHGNAAAHGADFVRRELERELSP
jgi:hypothetical protein